REDPRPAALDLSGQLDLTVARQQRDIAQPAEVALDRVHLRSARATRSTRAAPVALLAVIGERDAVGRQQTEHALDGPFEVGLEGQHFRRLVIRHEAALATEGEELLFERRPRGSLLGLLALALRQLDPAFLLVVRSARTRLTTEAKWVTCLRPRRPLRILVPPTAALRSAVGCPACGGSVASPAPCPM